jgi:uncharacterized repeat protein (TIGR03803 family)
MRLAKLGFVRVILGLLLTLAMVSLTVHSQAFAITAESVLFNFNAGGTEATGNFPHSTLIEDAQGNLYGTTTNGGASEVGVVFELSPPATAGGAWTEKILWNFGNSTYDGRNPWTWGSGLAVDGNGDLYGTTQAGGMYAEGTAWELSPPATAGGAWTETIIWNFGNPAVTDGIDPTSGLTIDKNGNLFGTTLYGQSPTLGFAGTVYELSPPSGLSGTWTETILQQFSEGGLTNYENGFYPYAGVIGDGSGDLFGTTSSGGLNGFGANPGGVLFEITSGGGYSVLWNFSGADGPGGVDDGADPMSGLIMDKQGNIYGTTALGGTSADFADLVNGVGTVFELSPPGVGGGSWNEQVLWNFQNNGTDGFSPMAGVVIDPNGNIYGTTEYGGLYSDEPYFGGTAFKLTPPTMAGANWGETILWNFGNPVTNDASLPWASLLIDPVGNLYGSALDGGSFGTGSNGAVYEIANAPTTISVAASLALGNSPVGDTIVKNLTVRNTGHANPLFVHVTSSDAEFAATGGGTCGTAGIAPLTSCTIAIGFKPNGLGARSATLSITDNTATSPQHVALTGTGTVTMTVAPTGYAFGSVKDGSKATKSITVHNYQTNAVSLGEGFTGPNAGDFTVTGGTCTSTLAKTSACSMIVTFAPTATGTEAATMTVTDSPDPLGPYTVSFTASATVPESLSATKLAFGNVYQTASKSLNLTVTNKATTGSITLTGVNIGGLNAGDFGAMGGTCGGSLAASSSCTYAVTFTPSTETAEAATLSVGVAEDPNGGPPAVSLTGTGLVPVKALPAAGIAFGTIASGHSSSAKTATVYNYGGAAVSLSENISGTNSGDFALTGSTCGSTLTGGGAHCTYTLKFTPSTTGAESATLGVSAGGDAASPHNLNLTGTGS